MTIFGDNESGAAPAGPSHRLGWVRLAIGLVQAVALWWLYRSASAYGWLCNDDGCPTPYWPATVPELFGPLTMIFVMVPVLLLAGVGRMRMRTLALWALAATVVLALLGWWDRVNWPLTPYEEIPGPRAPVVVFSAVALFIAHHLIAPADAARRWFAPFPAYFDTAWKAGVQLALSVAFVGAFWLLLFLGAGLFRVIGLDFLEDLLRKDWFNIPITCLAFALAVHLTDVRDGLIRGVRTVALMLLGWLLPVMTVLAAGFLIALPFTGLGGLWETGSATSLVLAAMAALIILINAVYQDGEPDSAPGAALRWAVRIAALILVPLAVLAFVGLGLRIGQHGLTPDRIIAAACAVVGALHAAGYAFAAVRPGPWMRPLERTNVIGAIGTVVVILALFSPIADPARLSVADQMSRLERGAVSSDQFDYAFLRFDSGRAGEKALAKLAASKDAEVAKRAKAAQAADNRYAFEDELEPPVEARFETYPTTATLPDGFAGSVPNSDPRSQCREAGECVAAPMDLNADGVPEVLLATRYAITLMARDATDGWSSRGVYQRIACPGDERSDLRELLKAGRVHPVAPAWPSLDISGRRAALGGFEPCPDARADAAVAAAAP